MEKKNPIKISLGTAVCIFIIFLLIISIVLMLYLNNNQRKSDNEKIAKLEKNALALNEKLNELQKEEVKSSNVITAEETTHSTSENTISESEVPMNELCALTYMATNESINLFYGYIEDGKLFYSFDNKTANSNSNSAFEYISTENIKQYDNLTNIKRIKIFNFGTGVNRVPLLITQDGKVYQVSIYDEELKISLFEELKDYNIDNILEVLEPDMSGENWVTRCKVLLNDGTSKTIEI